MRLDPALPASDAGSNGWAGMYGALDVLEQMPYSLFYRCSDDLLPAVFKRRSTYQGTRWAIASKTSLSSDPGEACERSQASSVEPGDTKRTAVRRGLEPAKARGVPFLPLVTLCDGD